MITDAEKRKLSPRDRLLAEFQGERDTEFRAQEIRDLNQFHAEMHAASRGLDLRNIKGRMERARTSAMRHNEAPGLKQRSLLDFMLASGGVFNPRQLLDKFLELTQSFQYKKTEQKPDENIYKTESCEFDLAKVSAATKAWLDREAGAINTKVRNLESFRSASTYDAEFKKIQELAEQYDMAFHPQAHIFVHHIDRVAMMEARNNPTADTRHLTGLVHVYRTRAYGAESLGVKRMLGDVCDQNPREAIASGSHLKGDNAPHLRHS